MNPSSTALASNDAELVARSLSGSREAFGEIVSRYQSLICAIAYSGTGSIARSEDLAQETLLTAWKQLRELRDPALLRPWLCGIARNLVHAAVRRDGREPSVVGGDLELLRQSPAEAPLPAEQAISRQEEAILWRSIELMPEIYREPLVLYYREHHSVERVASALGLSEDVVRQRLSRGRKLLQAAVVDFVEGALERSSPGKAFTLAVLASLPLLPVSASAATVGAGLVQGGALAKSAGALTVFTVLIGPLTSFIGAYGGVRAALQASRTPRERAMVFRQTAVLVAGSMVFTAVVLGLIFTRRRWLDHPVALGVVGAGFPAAFAVWLAVLVFRYTRETRRVRREEEARHPEAFRSPGGRIPIEFRSRATLLGLPLVHIRFGPPDEAAGPARGWIAAGDRAVGVLFAFGGVAMGGVSVGTVSLGVVSAGAVSVGLLSLGGVAVGVVALATVAGGLFALGAIAFGWIGATGAIAVANDLAYGLLAFADHPNDAVEAAFRARYHVPAVFQSLLALCCLLVVAPSLWVVWKTRRRGGAGEGVR